MSKIRLATVWLDGCSGCHMSFLDLDERLLLLGEKAELVYSPLVDFKEFPENVDVTLVEGAVSSEEDWHKIQKIRSRTKLLVSLGDCAVTSNVPAMRNPVGVAPLMDHAYKATATVQGQWPNQEIPPLLPMERPVHEVVKVDVFVPGCPPSADAIWAVLTELLEKGSAEQSTHLRFG